MYLCSYQARSWHVTRRCLRWQPKWDRKLKQRSKHDKWYVSVCLGARDKYVKKIVRYLRHAFKFNISWGSFHSYGRIYSPLPKKVRLFQNFIRSKICKIRGTTYKQWLIHIASNWKNCGLKILLTELTKKSRLLKAGRFSWFYLYHKVNIYMYLCACLYAYATVLDNAF